MAIEHSPRVLSYKIVTRRPAVTKAAPRAVVLICTWAATSLRVRSVFDSYVARHSWAFPGSPGPRLASFDRQDAGFS